MTAEAIALLIVATISIVIYAIALPAELLGLVTGRGAQFGTVTVVSTALLIGIVGLIYVQLARAAITADLTQAELYSLSPESERVLLRLREPLQIVGFYSPRLLPQRDLDDQFFRLYEMVTGGVITRRYIDPDAQPALAQRFGLTQDGQTFLVYLDETGDFDLETITRVPRTGNQERDMTGAIARLIAAGTTTVYITTGMGDRDMFDEGQEGILGISAGMRESGINTLPLLLQSLAQTGGGYSNGRCGGFDRAPAGRFQRLDHCPARPLFGARWIVVHHGRRAFYAGSLSGRGWRIQPLSLGAFRHPRAGCRRRRLRFEHRDAAGYTQRARFRRVEHFRAPRSRNNANTLQPCASG